MSPQARRPLSDDGQQAYLRLLHLYAESGRTDARVPAVVALNTDGLEDPMGDLRGIGELVFNGLVSPVEDHERALVLEELVSVVNGLE